MLLLLFLLLLLLLLLPIVAHLLALVQFYLTIQRLTTFIDSFLLISRQAISSDDLFRLAKGGY